MCVAPQPQHFLLRHTLLPESGPQLKLQKRNMPGPQTSFRGVGQNIYMLSNAKRATQSIENDLCPPLGLSHKTLQSVSMPFTEPDPDAYRLVRVERFSNLQKSSGSTKH